MPHDDKLLKAILELYENQKLNQKEIARHLKVSQATVSRYLTQYRDLERVISGVQAKSTDQLQVSEGAEKAIDIKSKLKKKYNLKEVLIAHSMNIEELTGLSLYKKLGELAAQYIDKNIKEGYQIIVDHGRAAYYTVKQVSERRVIGLSIDSVSQIRNFLPNMSIGKLPAWVNAIVLSAKFWTEIDWDKIVPPEFEWNNQIDPIRAVEQMKENSKIKDAFERMKKTDIAILGVGPYYDNATIARLAKQFGYTIEQDREKIRGSICQVAIDEDGLPLKGFSLNSLAISFPLSDLHELAKDELRHIMLIAGGVEKQNIIDVALKSKYFNVLVTDYSVANHLLYF